jgi:membrane fusion protein
VVGRLDTDEGGQVKRGQVLAVVTVPSATLANGDTHAAIEQRLMNAPKACKPPKARNWLN